MSFNDTVLACIKAIPKGRITTYGEVARKLGSPHAARAVGNALNKNDRLISVPCHRVVRRDGRLGGYAGGKEAKAALLRREGLRVDKGKIADFPARFYRFE